MNLATQLREHIAACFPGIWIQSHEHDDAEAEIKQLCHAQEWTLATWDVDRGLATNGTADRSATDPLATLRALPGLATDNTTILLMRNLHRFLGSPEMVQALDTQISEGKARRSFVVVLSPVVDIPAEIARQMIVLEHDMPGRGQLEEIARGVATEPGDLPDGPQLAALLDASAGLTRMEAEGAYSLSLVRHGRIRRRSLGLESPGTQEIRPDVAPPGKRTLHRPRRIRTPSKPFACDHSAPTAAAPPALAASCSSACPAPANRHWPRPSAMKPDARRSPWTSGP